MNLFPFTIVDDAITTVLATRVAIGLWALYEASEERRDINKSADKTINLKRNKNREKRNSFAFWTFEHKKIVTQLNKYFPLADLRRTVAEGGGKSNWHFPTSLVPYVQWLSMRTGSRGFSMKVHYVGLAAHHSVIAFVEDGLRPPVALWCEWRVRSLSSYFVHDILTRPAGLCGTSFCLAALA